MRNVFTIAGREVRSYFSSPVAYVLLAAFLGLAGYFFFALLSAFNQSLAIYSMMRNPEMLQRFNLNEMVIRPLLQNMAVLLIFVIPPSLETLFQRLRTRATETADELELRQGNAALELARQHDYDYVVTNETGQVDRTADWIEQIIADEHLREPERRVRV